MTLAEEDRAGVAESILDRMVMLVHAVADYPGQPTVTQWDLMQKEAKAIINASRSLAKNKEK